MKEVYIDISENKLHIINKDMTNAVTVDISTLLRHDFDHLINFSKGLTDMPLINTLLYNKNSPASDRASIEYLDYASNGRQYKNPYDKYTEYDNWNDYEITWRKSLKAEG